MRARIKRAGAYAIYYACVFRVITPLSTPRQEKGGLGTALNLLPVKPPEGCFWLGWGVQRFAFPRYSLALITELFIRRVWLATVCSFKTDPFMLETTKGKKKGS